MISHIIIHRNGHFYLKDSGERLSLADGAELSISGNNDAFVPTEPVGKWEKEPLGPDALGNLEKNNAKKKYMRLYPAGEKLYFHITGKKERHFFEAELCEDLYAVLKGKSWGLDNCACKVVANINNNVHYFEVIYGKSLNELRKNTYVHFLGNLKNCAGNPMDNFFEREDCKGATVKDKIEEKLKKRERMKAAASAAAATLELNDNFE